MDYAEIHHRRSIRLKNYDYSSAGLYFVTICVNYRLPLFGEIMNGEMRLNSVGQMIEKEWQKLVNKFQTLKLHEFVVMPNHIHGIIELVPNNYVPEIIKLVGAIPCGRPQFAQLSNTHETLVYHRNVVHEGRPQGIAPTIGRIVGAFKSLTTNAYIRNVKQNNWQPFPQKLWQRDYHEHIIRNEMDYLRIADYVQTNPQRWQEDCYCLEKNS